MCVDVCVLSIVIDRFAFFLFWGAAERSRARTAARSKEGAASGGGARAVHQQMSSLLVRARDTLTLTQTPRTTTTSLFATATTTCARVSSSPLSQKNKTPKHTPSIHPSEPPLILTKAYMRALAAGRCCRVCAAAEAARVARGGAGSARLAAAVPASSAAAAPAAAAVVAAARPPRRASSSSPSPSSSPPPPPPAAAAAAAATRPLRRSRALLERRAPPESFAIKGVTFDGRQDLVARLRPGDPVALSREPWNAHDASAVRICSLRGEHLGYVDRRCTGAFSAREAAYGFVDSVGRAAEEGASRQGGRQQQQQRPEGGGGGGGGGAAGAGEAASPPPPPALGPWGARVVVWPFLAAPLPEVLPEALAAEADARLGLRFPWEHGGGEGGGPAAAAAAEAAAAAAAAAEARPLPARWRRLAAAALARARGVCEATGVAAGPAVLSPGGGGGGGGPPAAGAAAGAAGTSPSSSSSSSSGSPYGPLVVLPEWRWDESRRVVALAGAACVCAPVARCVRAARLPADRRAERAAALGLGMDVMRWSVEHMREYLKWQEARSAACEEQGWALDLGGDGDDDDEEDEGVGRAAAA
jgi:hypothetical protein